MEPPLPNEVSSTPLAVELPESGILARFDGVMVHDDGRIVRVDKKCAALFGCGYASIEGRDFIDFTAPEMRELVGAHFESGSGLPLECIGLKANGDRFPIELCALPVTGSPLRTAGIRDLSERRISARRQITRAERIRVLAEVAFDGMCVLEDGKLIEADDSLANMTGYLPEELAGLPFELLFPPALRDGVCLRVRSCDPGRFESLALRKDGTTLPVELCGTSLPDGESVTAFRDISKRRGLDDALLASEDRFRDLVENCHELIGTHDLEGRILSANPAVGRFLNAPSEGLRGQNVKEHLFKEDNGGFARYISVLHRDGAASGTVRVIASDGSSRLCEYQSSLRTAGVAAPVVRILARDVTEREAALAAVTHSEEHFRSIIENSPDLIAIIERSGRIRYHSPSIERVLGIVPDSVVGKAFLDLVHPVSVQRAKQFMDRQIADPAATGMVELRLHHENGSWRSFEVVARNLSTGGKVTAIVTNARDITDRKLLEAQLAQANRLSSLGRLAATVAHEFNNVLMGMQPFTELMQRPNAAPSMITKGVWHISNSIQRGKRIAMDILRFTQPAQPVTAMVDVGEWWEKFAPEAETVVGNIVRVVSNIPRRGLCVVADKEQLSQVMANLVANARDAMPGGGMLTVDASQPAPDATFPFGVVVNPDQFVQISVADSGHGVATEVMQHIFEPLFTTKKSGTGLGLAVAHQVLTQHGGYIFAESEAGRGTTFHLFVPKSVGSCVEPAAIVARSHQLRALTVLMIEDELPIVEGISALLQFEGMKVVAIKTGAEAAGAVATVHPDLVILDFGLPDMDGSQVYEMLRKLDPSLPIIFATGHGDGRAIHDGMSDARTRFLQKPFDITALLQMIGELLPGGSQP